MPPQNSTQSGITPLQYPYVYSLWGSSDNLKSQGDCGCEAIAGKGRGSRCGAVHVLRLSCRTPDTSQVSKHRLHFVIGILEPASVLEARGGGPESCQL